MDVIVIDILLSASVVLLDVQIAFAMETSSLEEEAEEELSSSVGSAKKGKLFTNVDMIDFKEMLDSDGDKIMIWILEVHCVNL